MFFVVVLNVIMLNVVALICTAFSCYNMNGLIPVWLEMGVQGQSKAVRLNAAFFLAYIMHQFQQQCNNIMYVK